MTHWHTTLFSFLFLAACGSSQDGAAGSDETQGSGGIVDVTGSGSSAGAGGASGASTGVGGVSGALGSVGTGGSASTGGASGAGGAGGITGAGGKSGAGGMGGRGGSSGGGGAGGATGMTGSPCTNLPQAGVWQSITPFSGGGPAYGEGWSEAMSIDPFDTAVVWLTTGYRGIYKSTDCGKTFVHMNTGRNAATFERGNHISMLADPVDRGVLYVANIHDSINLWKSTNGGVDWDPLFPMGSEVYQVVWGYAMSVAMDPGNHKHLMVAFHDNCKAPYAPACEAETNDAGATWRLIKIPFPGWQEGSGSWIIDATTSLYAGSGLFLTTDSGASWKDVTPQGVLSFGSGEREIHPIPRGPDGTYYLASNYGMLKSADAHSWTLIPNSGARLVSFASGDGQFITAEEYNANYWFAEWSDPTVWKTFAPPPTNNQGASYLDYDAVHKVLYSSNFGGGLWRLVLP
jgi:hypothetical protein